MNQEMILGIIRHILTIASGAVVVKGYTDESTATTIVGGIVAFIGVVWSIWAKRQAPTA